MTIPVIDITPLFAAPLSPKPTPEALKVSQEIYDACHTWGFFQITGHNVSIDVQKDLTRTAKEFFALPEEQKLALHVKNGGVAWRGYMPTGGEGTKGRIDQKAGMYFGPEHAPNHPQAGLPLHGKNQFPDAIIPGMRQAVLQYIDEVIELGKTITDALSLSLGLDGHFIREHYLQPEPVAFFRAWQYSLGDTTTESEAWGIGEHSGTVTMHSVLSRNNLIISTDFGLLTLLKQDSAGLQVSGSLSLPHESTKSS